MNHVLDLHHQKRLFAENSSSGCGIIDPVLLNGSHGRGYMIYVCVTIFKIYIYDMYTYIHISSSFHHFLLHNASANHKTGILSSKGILCCSSCFGPQYFPRIPNPILDNQTWAAKVARRPKWRLQQGRTLTLKQRSRHRQKPHLARRRPAKSLYQGSMKSPCPHFHRWMMQRRQELAPFAVPSKAHFG